MDGLATRCEPHDEDIRKRSHFYTLRERQKSSHESEPVVAADAQNPPVHVALVASERSPQTLQRRPV